jgi:hypothetical protein
MVEICRYEQRTAWGVLWDEFEVYVGRDAGRGDCSWPVRPLGGF